LSTLVIGSGLIGSQVARILVERGEKPVLMDTDLEKSTRYRDAHIDRTEAPNKFGVNEPSLSTQGIGCSCGG